MGFRCSTLGSASANPVFPLRRPTYCEEGSEVVSCDNDNNEHNEASIASKSDAETSHTLRNDHFSLAHNHILPPDVTAIWLFSTRGKYNSS